MNYHDKPKPLEGMPCLDGKEELDEEKILDAWRLLKLHDSFISACDSMPVESSCCSLRDHVKMTHDLVPYLNEHWAPAVNKKLQKKGLFVDVFLWSWSNISGKATTDILLIRFYEASERKEYKPRVSMLEETQFTVASTNSDGNI